MDLLGRRFVVLDQSAERIDGLELESYHADVPGLAADVRDPGYLGVAGLGHASCEAVVALTDDDESNLAVVMAAALLRPDVPVIARATSRVMADQMRAFGTPSVVNPFDCFGDHLRLALRAAASYQLLTWLESGPGAALPSRARRPAAAGGSCGYRRLGRELTADLRAEGIGVTVVEPRPTGADPRSSSWATVQPGTRPALSRWAVGFVAGTDNGRPTCRWWPRHGG